MNPRGAGFIFILVFMVSALLFAQISLEMIIYLVLIGAEMLTGFLDDASEKPWGELNCLATNNICAKNRHHCNDGQRSRQPVHPVSAIRYIYGS